MQMRRGGIRIPCKSDVTEQLAFLHGHSRGKSGTISIEMCVQHDVSLRRVDDINRQPARNAVVKLEHLTGIRREHLRSSRRHDVERFMSSRAAAYIVEAVDELVRSDSLNRNEKVVRAQRDKVGTSHSRER